LAEASYANLTGSSADEVKTALISSDPAFLGEKPFSETQATDFVEHWSVVAGSHQPDMPSGFSATLFKNKDVGGYLAGQYVLAIRGTGGTQDLLADGGDIILDGLAVGFKQQGKAAAGTCPRHLNGTDMTSARGDARHRTMAITDMLKKAQMLPLPLHGIMHRAQLSGFIGEARTWRKTDTQMQFIRAWFGYRKGDFLDLPRGLQA
jgi:hypothetical protein